ncbi:MAG: proton-conducting transporter membrane subunit [Gammaproteobacteria bacterium]|jgi:hypothetical protein
MSLLLALPLLPVAVLLWLAVSARREVLATGWLVALVAAAPLAVAVLMAPQGLGLPELLVQGSAALALDHVARAGLLLFGGAWFVAGLVMTHGGERSPSVFALLIALAGALTLALGRGGPLVYAGMLAVGYGLYGVVASERHDGWQRPGAVLIVLLVVSDLLVFEVLLEHTAHPVGAGLGVVAVVALALRAAVPPAHGWLPQMLQVGSAPAAVLLATVPAGAAWLGGVKLVPSAGPGVAVLCLVLGVAGAAWATVAGLAQRDERATLGYAVAASSALLFIALPAGVDGAGPLPWLVLAMLAACGAQPLLRFVAPGWRHDLAVALMLLAHGLAAGDVAAQAGARLPPAVAVLPGAAALLATLVLTLAVRRIAAEGISPDRPHGLVFTPALLAIAGLGAAWWLELPGFASAWPAPLGITLGLLAHRLLDRSPVARAAGDLLDPVESLSGRLVTAAGRLCVDGLGGLRDRCQAALLGLWDGPAWSRRMQRLDIRLRSWPATSLMMLTVALVAAYLLAR